MEEIQDLGLNVILPANASEIPIPPISLRITSPKQLFNALSILGDQAPVKFAWIPSSPLIPNILGPNGQIMGNDTEVVWVLTGPESSMVAKPFAIGHLLEHDQNEFGYSVDEITSVIASTVKISADVGNRESELDFQYHEGTELLIIIGKTDDLRITAETLSALRDSMIAKQVRNNPYNVFMPPGQGVNN
jgi:hypothetical protein